jgi:hypothetical protein
MSNFRWSFSQWETYNQCPAKWKYAYVDMLPRKPPGPAAARGIEMHDRVERYIKGEIDADTLVYGDTTLRFGAKKPAVVNRKFVPMLDEFKDHPNGDRWCELKLAFDAEWYPAALVRSANPTGETCVMVLDAARAKDGVVHVGEWKSGQPKDTHADQRKIYALGALRKWFPEQVVVTTYYLEDTAPPQQLTVKASAEQKLRDLWRGRIDEMQQNNICAPRPGDYCRYMCDYAASKGGPCQFGA